MCVYSPDVYFSSVLGFGNLELTKLEHVDNSTFLLFVNFDSSNTCTHVL